MIRYALLLALALTGAGTLAQTAEGLKSGPMLGYVEHRAALIWLEVNPEVGSVRVDFWKKSTPDSVQSVFYGDQPANQAFNPIHFELYGLEPGVTYECQVVLDDKPVILPYKLEFTTKTLWEWRKPAPDFTFLTGSCAYINEPKYDRPGRPYGNSYAIFDKMAEQQAAFMLWLGDNVYTREVDLSSAYGIFARYSHDRATPELQRFLAAMPHYAIWDDHDFGPNDSDKSFELKEASREAFISYWGNRTYGENGQGIYTKERYSDCDFFLLDDRWFRSCNNMPDSINGQPNPDKRMHGQQQMEWLKNSLLYSNAPFKFIATGNQVINPISNAEAWWKFPAEYQDFLKFLQQNKITGVVFLTGDRHHSEVIKMERPGTYPLYDITSSPITSGAGGTLKTPEKDNPSRVSELVATQNFTRATVSGEKGKRVLNVEFVDGSGAVLGKFQVSENDLK